MSRSETDTRFARLKWRRAFDQWESKLARWVEAAKTGFNPNQPRVPAGNPDGGQWTGGGGGAGDGPVLSDANPDFFTKPGTRVAQARGPNRGSTIRVGNRRLPATVGQSMRFGAADRRAKQLVKRAQELDPTWKPRPSLTDPNSINGAIAARRGEAREAEARIRNLASKGIGPGPFAKESIPARNSGRNFRIDERREGNRMGYQHGCSTCGSRDPGTASGNFVLDHQDPTGLNQPGRPQRLYPQCLTCSLRQGGNVNALKRRGKKK